MKFRFFALLLFLVGLSGSFAPVRATTIDPLTLEQMVSGASFVGIIECETAGGIVAEYRVIESWKGMPVGTRFRLKTPFNYWEPQFPIALVAQRVVVTAYQSDPPARVTSTTGGGGVPLWWRDITYEYSLPLFQGMASVPDTVTPQQDGHKYYAFGEEFSSFEPFRARVKNFVSLSPEQTEIALMRSIFNKYEKWRDNPEETPEIRELKRSIASAKTAAQMAEALLLLREKDKDARIAEPLASGGAAATLEFLASLPDEKWPLDEAERKRVLNSIQARLKEKEQANKIKPPTPKKQESLEEPPPSAAEMEQMRAILRDKTQSKGDESYEKARAIETLTRYDPAMVTKYLVEWKNPQESWRDANQGYFMGSFFAWRCGGERAIYLRRLDKAHDPYIRVAGAVYLFFENPKEGLAKLRELANLPGDPGVWAALNLARRGDKSVMPRALQIFASEGKSNMEGVPHRNLQKRLLVLLSNSARHSKVPRPLADFEKSKPSDNEGENEVTRSARQYEHLQKWWKQHQEKIELHDPWLPLLEKQKVD